MLQGTIFNIQRYSLHDGPGIRTTVFFKGCPLRCSWCHNPESQAAEPTVSYLENRCVRCGMCIAACPQGGMGPGGWPEQARRCVRCGACVEVCPSGARQLIGRTLTVDELLDEILKDRLFFEESGGGATFSGGEPLLQSGFLAAVLARCRAEMLHTVVDTCGHASTDALLNIARLVDLFLYDIKALDDDLHRRLTGASNGLILENLRALSRVHRNIWLRVPLLPGLNDSDEQLGNLSRFAASVPAVRRVHLLPYHRLGSQKLASLGCAEPDSAGGRPAREPTADDLQRAAEFFRTAGLPVYTGG